jgi:hypothetical protein
MEMDSLIRGYGLGDSRFPVVMMLGLFVVPATLPPASSAPPTPDESGAPEPVDSIDLRPVFAKWGLPPRAQGDRGTCSVFTITGAIEYALAEKRQRATRLSVEFLNWGSNRTIEEFRDGGFFSDLWKGFESYGICAEEDLPYRKEFNPELQPSPAALERARRIHEDNLELHWIKKWDPNKGLTEDQFTALKATLRRRKPVCGGLLWPKAAKWVDGVLQMAPREAVRDGHSVILVGFRDAPSQPGGGVFLVWNSSQGPRQGAMSYEYVRAYMNDAVWVDSAAGPTSD